MKNNSHIVSFVKGRNEYYLVILKKRKIMEKLFISLLVASGLVFSGCGGGSDGGDTDESINAESTSDNIIDTDKELYELYDLYKTTVRKSDYETTAEYNSRIEQFIDAQGIVKYKYDLKDVYDADTQTLYVYDVDWSDRGKLWLDYGLLCHNYGNTDTFYCENYIPEVRISNLHSFPWTVGYAPTDYWQDSNRIFYSTNISAEDARSLHNKFYLIIETQLTTELPIAEHTYSTYVGNSYFINTLAVKIQVLNESTDITYDEYSINY